MADDLREGSPGWAALDRWDLSGVAGSSGAPVEILQVAPPGLTLALRRLRKGHDALPRPRRVARRTGVFLKEFVILFGFLNGLWLALGINPGAELLEVLRGIVESLLAGVPVRFIFTLLPLVFLGAILWLIHKRGGWLGFLAVGLGFVAGLQILAAPRVSFFLLLAAMALGYVATAR